MTQPSRSAAVEALLSRIIDDTNAKARRVLPAKVSPPTTL